MSFKACIYDLDGVITDTAVYHFQSWQWVADQIHFDLSPKYHSKLKSIGRKESLERMLKWASVRISEAEKQHLLHEKNKIYLGLIDQMGPSEVFPGFKKFNQELRNLGIKVGVGSSSTNAIRIIDKLDLVLDFDAIVDGRMIQNRKPEPEIFLQTCEKLQIKPEDCVVIEDSQDGIEAASAAKMKSISFGQDGPIKAADLHFKDWGLANVNKIKDLY